MAPTLPQPAPSRARTLEAGQGLGRLAQHRAASRPGLCAIAPGRRAGAPPVWKLTRSVPVQPCKHPPAASLRRGTTELAELINKVPTLQALREMNGDILMLGGGLPIEIGGDVIGGIGVGGAPGGHLDDACAQAGLDAIGAAPKVPAK